jgi:hypothetical protein
MSIGNAMNDLADRERRSRRLFIAIMVGALVCYLGYKTWHISVALEAWQGQSLTADTSRAAR